MRSSGFQQRAHLTEWMDGPCSEEDLRGCLHDLEQVNRTVFVYRPTLAWLNRLVPKHDEPLHIVDVGCGGGDMLRQIERWARSRSLNVTLTGIDQNERALRFAQQRTAPSSSIQWLHGNAADLPAITHIDIAISSHVAHHLSDEELVRFLQWMEANTRVGWFINDLHRMPVPYYAFHILSRLMRWHPFIRHDGPISVRRAFRHDDWFTLLTNSGIPDAEVQSFWPGRLCVQRSRSHV